MGTTDKTLAGQPVERVTKLIERAVVKAAASGDQDAVRTLRRMLSHVDSPLSTPPVVFRGRKQIVFEAALRGATPIEMERISGANHTTVWRWRNSEDFKAALSSAFRERRMSALSALDALVPIAIKRAGEILKDPSAKDSDVNRAIEIVLDRGGVPKTERVEHEVSTELGLDDLEELEADIRAGAELLTVLEGGRKEEAG